MGGDASRTNLPKLASTALTLELSNRQLYAFPFYVEPEHKIYDIDLTNNNIQDIPPGLMHLVRLKLKSNGYTTIPLKVHNSILSYPKLICLDLSSNGLKFIPPNIIRKASLLKLLLSSNLINGFSTGSQHIEQLDLAQNKLKLFSPELFPSAIILIIDYNLTEKIVIDNPKLTKFQASMNMITSLTIKKNCLETLDISKNKLTILPDFNESTPYLKRFNASFNRISNFPMFPKSIEEISLSNNCIHSIDYELNDFINLHILDVSENSINYLPELPVSLEKLFANGNQIEKIENNKLPALTELALFCNSLTEYPFTELQVNNLCLYRNKLEILPNFSEIIVFLNLSFNNIEKVPLSVLEMPNIERLVLSNNKIKEIPAFHSESLNNFNISENPIESMPEDLPSCISILSCASCHLTSIPKYSHIEILKASNNQLKDIPIIEGIKALYLSCNEFETFPIVSPTVTILDLSCNKISSIPEQAIFPNLVEFDLSYNNLTVFPLPLMDNIRVLKLANNTGLVAKLEMKYMQQLETLDISGTENVTMTYPQPPSIREIIQKINKNEERSVIFKNYESNSFVGYAEMKGDRPTMEDSLIVYPFICGQSDVYCVFDGHGGSKVSDFCTYELTKLIKSLEIFKMETISNCFETLDNELRSLNYEGGTTIAFATLTEHSIISSHCGDSRVLVINDEGEIMFATKDHKPNNRIEIERILQYGGRVEHGRVDGIIAISRTFGDFAIESVKPDFQIAEIAFDQTAKWLIVACDGVFDVIENEEIGKMTLEASSAYRLAYDIRNMAYHRSSMDNISVIAVDLAERRKHNST